LNSSEMHLSDSETTLRENLAEIRKFLKSLSKSPVSVKRFLSFLVACITQQRSNVSQICFRL
jgi:hypothetical protein